MDEICDDEDSINIRETGSLINTTSYHKEFGFSRCNINYVMYYLDDWIVMDMDV